jgi:hypothetical protein
MLLDHRVSLSAGPGSERSGGRAERRYFLVKDETGWLGSDDVVGWKN